MNTVTKDTARVLVDAGFPKPAFSVGQIWYDIRGNQWVIGKNTGDTLIAKCLSSNVWEHLIDTNGFVFAPMATDIIREIGTSAELYFNGEVFVLSVIEHGFDPIFFFKHENPHEATAEAYLEIKNNNNK